MRITAAFSSAGILPFIIIVRFGRNRLWQSGSSRQAALYGVRRVWGLCEKGGLSRTVGHAKGARRIQTTSRWLAYNPLPASPGMVGGRPFTTVWKGPMSGAGATNGMAVPAVSRT